MVDPIRPMTQQTYDRYHNSNSYIEKTNKLISYKGSIGRYVIFQKKVGPVEKVFRLVACIMCCPCITLTCCAECSQKAADELAGPCCGEKIERDGVLPDPQKTREFEKRDDEQLGLNRDNLADFIVSKKYPLFKCPDYPEHLYMTFYGPVTTHCYIIFIPFGKFEKATIGTLFDSKTGKPLNTERARQHARTLAGGYREGVNLSCIREEKQKVVIASTNYGGVLLDHKTVIRSD